MLPKLYLNSELKVPVILLHGIGGAARFWEPQINAFLRSDLRPVALDLPGYGDRPPVHATTFDDHRRRH